MGVWVDVLDAVHPCLDIARRQQIELLDEIVPIVIGPKFALDTFVLWARRDNRLARVIKQKARSRLLPEHAHVGPEPEMFVDKARGIESAGLRRLAKRSGNRFGIDDLIAVIGL